MSKISMSPVLTYDAEKKQVRNQFNAIVCEISPDRVDQTGIYYAGNCEQRVEQMVNAWNELSGDQTPSKVMARIVRDIRLVMSMSPALIALDAKFLEEYNINPEIMDRLEFIINHASNTEQS